MNAQEGLDVENRNADVSGGSQIVVDKPPAGELPAKLNGQATVESMRLPGAVTKGRSTATRRQVTANRRNALRSTGPRTLEGKQIAARNAIKHGLTSTSVLLPGDDPAEYQRFATGIRIYWSPFGEQEKFLMQIIIDSAWVRLRFSKIEAGVLRFLLSDDVEPGVLADASNRVLETLSRYGTTKERTLTRAMRDLERLQDRRRRNASRPIEEQLALSRDIEYTMTAFLKQNEKLVGPLKNSGKEKAQSGSAENETPVSVSARKSNVDANLIGSKASKTPE
jgi:hypothetical protein